jgi:hypothetical protein
LTIDSIIRVIIDCIQLCCISKTIERILDVNSSTIDQYLQHLQDIVGRYKQTMNDKLDVYQTRDIRSPVLIIPCPTEDSSSRLFTNMRLRNGN